MRLPPIAVLLEWPSPNYADPELHGLALLVVNFIFITLVAVAVAGRLYSRIAIKRWYGADDSMIILAFLFTVGMTVVVILANVSYGWNRHLWDLTAAMIPAAGKIAFVAKLMFTLAATFTRLSLICFYYRLVQDSRIKWFNWVLHASVAWTVAVGITFVCETIWLCRPIAAYWAYPPIYPAYCLDEGTVMLSGGIINCFSDLLTTVLPIPIIMKLQMPLRQRIGVCILLCLGFIVTTAGVIRTYYIWKALMDSYDETWYSYPLWIAAAVEIDLAVICACAPAWKSLLQQPLAHLSSRVSSRMSFRRSPTTSRGTPTSSSHSKPRPPTSMPHSDHDLEKGPPSPTVQVAVEELYLDPGTRDRGRRSSGTGWEPDPQVPPSRKSPSLLIMKRQSVEQESAPVQTETTVATGMTTLAPRRSSGALLPGQWMGG